MSTSSGTFFKFPHTPHLMWLSKAAPRADKVLGPEEAKAFLKGDVVVEEKVDGANVGISVTELGELAVQNRGTTLGPGAHPQFQALWPWLARHREGLLEALGSDRMLFGEWCFAVHSVKYTRLVDWFLAFDVYDRRAMRFWSSSRRDALLADVGIAPVPHVARGRFTIPGLLGLLGDSRLTDGPMEGLYIRREGPEWLMDRAKIVRAEFVQAIEEHWSARKLEKNRVVDA